MAPKNPVLQKKPHPLDIIEIERNVLRFGALYPQDDQNIFYYIRMLFTLIMSLGLFFAMSIKLVMTFVTKDISTMIEILYYLPQQIGYVCKMINFFYFRKKFRTIEKFLESSLFNQHTENQYIYLNEAITETRFIANIFRVLCCLVVLFYAITPLGGSHMKMPLPGWFPFDTEKYVLYVYFFEVGAVAISATMNSHIDIIDVNLIKMATAQLNVLTDNIRNVITDEEISKINKNELNEICEGRVRSIAQHHQIILEYLLCVEDTFTFGIFSQFVLSMLVICMTGFNMLMVSVMSWDFVLLIIFFSCMMNEVALYCWFGNDVLLKSLEVVDSCYETKWYELNPKINKTIWIIMERARRPIILTAGKFFVLSLATLMMLVRSSYSYFAVLQRTYSKQD